MIQNRPFGLKVDPNAGLRSVQADFMVNYKNNYRLLSNILIITLINIRTNFTAQYRR